MGDSNFLRLKLQSELHGTPIELPTPIKGQLDTLKAMTTKLESFVTEHEIKLESWATSQAQRNAIALQGAWCDSTPVEINLELLGVNEQIEKLNIAYAELAQKVEAIAAKHSKDFGSNVQGSVVVCPSQHRLKSVHASLNNRNQNIEILEQK
jgi:hypothetical protein